MGPVALNARALLATLLVATLPSPLVGQGVDSFPYFRPDHVLEFAEHLFREGDYARAAGEFHRYLALQTQPERADTILFRIGTCYRLGGDHAKARTYFRKVLSEDASKAYADRARCEIAWSYFKTGHYDSSMSYIRDHAWQDTGCRVGPDNLAMINHLHRKRWEAAHHVAHSRTSGGVLQDSLTVALDRLAVEGMRLPRKSVVLGAALSAALPGAGKVYAGRLGDALYSILTIGLTAWQAQQGFSRDGVSSTKGWVYGSICGGLYVGNVYGSAVAVRIYNRSLEESLLDRIQEAVGVHVE